MKKLFILVLTIALVSCNTGDDTPSGTPESSDFYFQENKEISVTTSDELTFSSVVDGDNLVFSYIYNAAQLDDIADDEYSEIIRFQIDPTVESFTYTDGELSEALAYFRISCFCSGDSSAITGGFISGNKVTDNRWDVTIDVSFERNDEIESRVISESFILRE